MSRRLHASFGQTGAARLDNALATADAASSSVRSSYERALPEVAAKRDATCSCISAKVRRFAGTLPKVMPLAQTAFKHPCLHNGEPEPSFQMAAL